VIVTGAVLDVSVAPVRSCTVAVIAGAITAPGHHRRRHGSDGEGRTAAQRSPVCQQRQHIRWSS
jgi:hypothetical protein